MRYRERVYILFMIEKVVKERGSYFICVYLLCVCINVLIIYKEYFYFWCSFKKEIKKFCKIE